jgi:hypothetical protein
MRTSLDLPDPIVEEIRKIRDQQAAEFGNDLHAICEDLRRKQAESGITVVTRPPRKPLAV